MIDNSFVLRIFFLGAALLATLFFGLHPKDFGGEHIPSINQTGDLSFTKYSIATVDTNWSYVSEIDTKQGEPRLSINLEIPVIPDHRGRFAIIFSINDTLGYSQMLLGQWKNSLVIMSGNDYSNQSNQPRITVPLDSVPGYAHPQKVRVEIETTVASTSVFINEHMMARSTHYKVPLSNDIFTVSLGNTLNRKHGWLGTISAFTLDYKNCTTVDTGENLSHCHQTHTIDLNEALLSLSNSTNYVLQQSSTLVLHSPYTMLSMEWLSLGSTLHRNSSAHIKDVLINLLGFIPVALGIFIICTAQYKAVFSAITTIIATIFLSLLIESVQVFIPSRTSSIIDVTANSLAGVCTALFCYAVMRWFNTTTEPRQSA